VAVFVARHAGKGDAVAPGDARRQQHAVSPLVLLAYGVLYVVWGSTYLAMKIAVAHVPPFFGAATRFAFAGLLLFVVGRLLDRTPLTRRHVVGSALQALLLLVLGNALVMFAMRSVPSGVGALVVATTPLFIALFAGDRRRSTWTGLLLGLLGVAILVDPFATDRTTPLTGLLLLVGASASWGLGAIVLKRVPVHPSNATAVGLQMVIGALAQGSLSWLSGESVDVATVPATAWWALGYLTLFGSLLGFTCYGWLLKIEPPTRVATYAFVNPVVAVLLGAAVGGEPLAGRVVVAAVVIVAAVALILLGQRAHPPPRR
jgi:drug/metabolite transporter (DMT)-like permease